MAITQPGVILYTVYVRKGCHCASDIKIVADDREVEMRIILFSKWPLVDAGLLCSV